MKIDEGAKTFAALAGQRWHITTRIILRLVASVLQLLLCTPPELRVAPLCGTAATVCAVLSAVSAALVLTSRARASKAIEAESLLFVRLPSSSLLAQRQRSLMDVPRGQVLDIDFIPEGFDGSWDLMRMDEDGA